MQFEDVVAMRRKLMTRKMERIEMHLRVHSADEGARRRLAQLEEIILRR